MKQHCMMCEMKEEKKPGRGDHDSAAIARHREEVMRPWPTLGYDRDQVAMHLISREAFGVAEEELRRAVWLNPYEPRFKVHLAWCLCRQKRYSEARELIEQLPEDWMTEMVADIKRLIERWQRENSGGLHDAHVGDKAVDEPESRT